MELTNKQITVIFKALCDENRVQIFRLLQGGERCACELLDEMQLSQPTLSHHMKILCDSGLVVGRKEGKWMHYSYVPSHAGRTGGTETKTAFHRRCNGDDSWTDRTACTDG